jgi:hypothetical protein
LGSEGATKQKDPHHQNLMAKCSNRIGNLGKGSEMRKKYPNLFELPGMDYETY